MQNTKQYAVTLSETHKIVGYIHGVSLLPMYNFNNTFPTLFWIYFPSAKITRRLVICRDISIFIIGFFLAKKSEMRESSLEDINEIEEAYREFIAQKDRIKKIELCIYIKNMSRGCVMYSIRWIRNSGKKKGTAKVKETYWPLATSENRYSRMLCMWYIMRNADHYTWLLFSLNRKRTAICGLEHVFVAGTRDVSLFEKV